MNWKIALILALSFIVILFTVQNYQATQVKFLFWAFTASRALVLFLTLSIGVIIGWAGSYIGRKKK